MNYFVITFNYSPNWDEHIAFRVIKTAETDTVKIHSAIVEKFSGLLEKYQPLRRCLESHRVGLYDYNEFKDEFDNLFNKPVQVLDFLLDFDDFESNPEWDDLAESFQVKEVYQWIIETHESQQRNFE